MKQRKLVATNFLTDARTKSRVRTDVKSAGIWRLDHSAIIAESRVALKDAVASARLESITIRGSGSLEAAREAMKPVRAHFDKERAHRRTA